MRVYGGYIGKCGENDAFRDESLSEQKAHAVSQYFGLSGSRTGKDLEDRIWRCGDSFKLSFVELLHVKRGARMAGAVY